MQHVPDDEDDKNDTADDYADHAAFVVGVVVVGVIVIALSQRWSTEGRESWRHCGEGCGDSR